MMTLDDYFDGYDLSRQLFDALYRLVLESGPVELRVTKSQVAFVHGNAFAWAWVPGRYLRRKAAPLVLTLVFNHRDPSSRWKEIVEPKPGKFTHHLEITSTYDLDDQVRTWLQEAWQIRNAE